MKPKILYLKNKVDETECRRKCNPFFQGWRSRAVTLCMMIALGAVLGHAEEAEPVPGLGVGSNRHSVQLAPDAVEAMSGRSLAISLHEDTLSILLAPERSKQASLVQVTLSTGEISGQFNLEIPADNNLYLKADEDRVWILFRDTGRLLCFDFSGTLKKEASVLPENFTKIQGQYFDGNHWWILATRPVRTAGFRRHDQYGVWRFDPESGEMTAQFEVPQYSRSILGIVGLSFAAENLADVVVEETQIGTRTIRMYRRYVDTQGQVSLRGEGVRQDLTEGRTWQANNQLRAFDMRGTRHADKWIYMIQEENSGGKSGLLLRLDNFNNLLENILIVEEGGDVEKVLLDCDVNRVVWMVSGDNAVHWATYSKSHWWFPVKVPAEPWPTKERPIVRRRGEGLVFGGQDGDERIQIQWPRGTTNIEISPCARWAVAIITGERESINQQIVLFGPDGKELQRSNLPSELVDPILDPRNRIGGTLSKTIINQSGEILVSTETYEVDRRRTISLGDAEIFFIGLDGQVKDLGISTFPREMRLLYRKTGFIILTDEGDHRWSIFRVDTDGNIIWKQQVENNNGGVPLIWPVNNDSNIDVSVTVNGAKINITRDGEIAP